MSCLKREAIFSHMPRRRSNRGEKSTINAKELSGPIPREKKLLGATFGRKLNEDDSISLNVEAMNLRWEPHCVTYCPSGRMSNLEL